MPCHLDFVLKCMFNASIAFSLPINPQRFFICATAHQTNINDQKLTKKKCFFFSLLYDRLFVSFVFLLLFIWWNCSHPYSCLCFVYNGKYKSIPIHMCSRAPGDQNEQTNKKKKSPTNVLVYSLRKSISEKEMRETKRNENIYIRQRTQTEIFLFYLIWFFIVFWVSTTHACFFFFFFYFLIFISLTHNKLSWSQYAQRIFLKNQFISNHCTNKTWQSTVKTAIKKDFFFNILFKSHFVWLKFYLKNFFKFSKSFHLIKFNLN